MKKIFPKIAPSILAANPLNLERDAKEAEKNGAYRISVDVMDGHFVPDITFGPSVVSNLKKIIDIDIEVHLMVDNPELQSKSFIDAGADVITFHFESTKDSEDLIRYIKQRQIRVGIAIKPETQVNDIKGYLSDIDEITIMTVVPGKGGQSLIKPCLNKVKELIKIREDHGLKFLIQIDGGVKKENICSVFEIGADIAVVGTGIFNENNNIQYNIKSLFNLFEITEL